MLLVSLAGLAALAVTANNMGAIGSHQESNLTFHANTQASTRAWQGVEIIRLYLEQAGTTITTGEKISVPSQGGLSATLSMIQQQAADGTWSEVASIDSTKPYRVRAQIQSQAGIASRAIETVYLYNPSSNTETPTSTPDIKLESVSIHSNLILQGGVNIKGSTNGNFMVDGNADLSGSVTGINELCATGDVKIQSDITVNRVCSNKSVTISQSATILEVIAIGQVNLNSGRATVDQVHSNADVIFGTGGTTVNTVNTKGNVTITSGSGQITGTLNSEGNVVWKNTFAGNLINANGNVEYRPKSAATINSRGNVTLLAGDSRVQNIFALGWIDLQSSGGGAGVTGQLRGGSWVNWKTGNTIVDGIVRGDIKGTAARAWEPIVNVFKNPNLVIDIPLVSVAVIDPIVMERPEIDANQFKDSANYVFFYENGKRKVTVRNVDGIDNGTYFIASYTTNNKNDYLCTAVDGAGKCSAPTTPGKTLCMGFGNGNACFDQSSAGNWVFNGQSMAPGTAWFEGNLKLANGTFINTFLATGNINITQGSVKIYSPNYAGYAGVCTDSKGFVNTDSRLAGIKPKNYCINDTFEALPLGNVALLAGSYTGSTFQGGDIALSASNQIYGTIMAGGLLKTSGSTKIVGALVVANTPKSNASTTIQGGVTIDLGELPSTFDPTCDGSDCNSGGTPTTCSGSTCNASATVLWSRYL